MMKKMKEMRKRKTLAGKAEGDMPSMNECKAFNLYCFPPLCNVSISQGSAELENMQLLNLSLSDLCAPLKDSRVKEREQKMGKYRDAHEQNSRQSVAPERAAVLWAWAKMLCLISVQRQWGRNSGSRRKKKNKDKRWCKEERKKKTRIEEDKSCKGSPGLTNHSEHRWICEFKSLLWSV